MTTKFGCRLLPVEVRPEPAWSLENQCELPCVGSSAWNSNTCELEVAVALGSQRLQREEPMCWE